MTFQEEFLALLKKHRIEYDDRYCGNEFQPSRWNICQGIWLFRRNI